MVMVLVVEFVQCSLTVASSVSYSLLNGLFSFPHRRAPVTVQLHTCPSRLSEAPQSELLVTVTVQVTFCVVREVVTGVFRRRHLRVVSSTSSFAC